jgi:phage terminase small subunit
MTPRGRKSSAVLQLAANAPLRRRPKPPAGLSEAASSAWKGIVSSLPADFFRPGDLPLLQAFCVAVDRKNRIDALLDQDLIMGDKPHPGLKLSRDEAGLMASLAVKLRLCQSARTRPESAGLKNANAGPRPWDDASPASKFFA